MKKFMLIFILFSTIIFLSCSDDDDSDDFGDRDFKQDMRDFVICISQYAKSIQTDFIVIPQNGIELVTENGDEADEPSQEYLSSIDGHGQEDLFYGYDNDDEPTPIDATLYLQTFLNISSAAGNTILVTDYCSTPTNMDDSYALNNAMGYISFAADHRKLDNIPIYPTEPYNVNTSDILELSETKNFLYLINSELYETKEQFLTAIQNTNYDLILIDLFFDGTEELTSDDITSLKTKANGGTRLAIAYMSIGEAEDYRYYWQESWTQDPPDWLEEENPDWEGNYKVQYWDNDWQDIIFGNDDSYLKKILDAGFDGVYLDIIDAFEYFED